MPSWARQLAAPSASPSPELRALFDRMFQAGLRLHPESATLLGFDKGANADLKAQLSDESDIGRATSRASTQADLAALAGIDRASLSESDRIDYDTVLYTRRSAAALQAFDFGGSAFGPSPYAVSQLTGAYQSVPDFLDTKHRIETAADADAYLARLDAFAAQLDDNTDARSTMRRSASSPPDFMLDLTLEQMIKTRGAGRQVAWWSPRSPGAPRARGSATAMASDAADDLRREDRPALDRQIAISQRAARHVPRTMRACGASRTAPAYYAAALHNTTTTSAHRPRRSTSSASTRRRRSRARLDGLLKAQGLTKGTVGERIAALYKDPRQLYPNTDAGKVEAIAYCNARLDAIRAAAADRLQPRAALHVRGAPRAAADRGRRGVGLQPGAGARRIAPRPRLFQPARQRRMAEVLPAPRPSIHEGLPGHQLEGGLALSNTALPLIRKTIGFSGYAEGWALYAEQLADEIGMYDDDPLGRIGYLKFQLFRANRCVVDTGIHHLRWSREQAIAYFVEQRGRGARLRDPRGRALLRDAGPGLQLQARPLDVHGHPREGQGQAGRPLRHQDFHEAVLAHGRVPLEILQQIGDRWVATLA